MVDYLMLVGLKPPISKPAAKPTRQGVRSRDAEAICAGILAAMDQSGVPMSCFEISADADISTKTAGQRLNGLAKRGVVRSWIEKRDGHAVRLWSRA